MTIKSKGDSIWFRLFHFKRILSPHFYHNSKEIVKRKIKKIVVANRGEIALRIMRTCREMGIQTVAVYSDVDRMLPFVRFSDKAFCIGAPQPKESYLDAEKIIDVAKKTNADAIHPGYGFLSENSSFAKLVEENGIIFIGPSSKAIETLGDKTKAKQLLRNSNVPTVPGTDEPITDIQQAKIIAKEISFPVLIKAAAGGGGKGMRIVEREEELEDAIRLCQSEALNSFKDSRVFIEKYLQNPRHIEIQILGDSYGNIIHLGERECSIQRRHQKIIEESPSPIVTEELRTRMGNAAVEVAKLANYSNAGTVEFLVDEKRNFYFLEVNTRLQVEHPVTELVTGIDLVREQIRVAEGEKLAFTQSDISLKGSAIECRIYAEDSANNFFPSTGAINYLHSPSGVGVREDKGIDEGNEISIYYDPMIAKLITYSDSRITSTKRMKRALSEYIIDGVQTNIQACLQIISQKDFFDGNLDTSFITKHFPNGFQNESSEEEKIAAAVFTVLFEKNNSTQNKIKPSNGTNSVWKKKRIGNFR
ncbi:MAG: acetyl-CoA carboxylase biotin carboxylase subunit [Ignavibacteriales bacterium]|nr:acetyl-CoA carboxylase biotin carboxylase subunit [Ignavibacteriales bacterium]